MEDEETASGVPSEFIISVVQDHVLHNMMRSGRLWTSMGVIKLPDDFV